MANWKELKNDPTKWDKIFIKESIIKTIRKYFEAKNYHELESPILAPSLPQERYLDVIPVNITDKKGNINIAYLIPSTERYNKIALSAGIGNHFVITKVFRGLEEFGPNHTAEFTMLEWYELGHNYFDLMATTEKLFKEIKQDINAKFHLGDSLEIIYDGKKISLEGEFPKISIRNALKDFSGINLEEIQDIEDFRKVAKENGYSEVEEYDWQTIFELIFANDIEPNLPEDKPCFVYDYPVQLCPLTKTNAKDPLVAEKVEIYLAGKEVGNGYTELTDGVEQEKRFKVEQQARKDLGKPEVAFDYEMVEAMKSGMPEVAGIGIGLDRLAMIFADAQNIREVNIN